VCELGMPIIFVFYVMMEAVPTSEMCFKFKKKDIKVTEEVRYMPPH
jgi:hypothetical protein